MALSDINFDSDPRSRLRLNDQLQVLSMGHRSRKRLLSKIGNEIKQDTRDNIHSQKTVDGSRMEPRRGKKRRSKRKRRSAKILSRMGKGMVTRFRNDGFSADITWKNAGQAKCAYRNQMGIGEDYKADKDKAVKRAEKEAGGSNPFKKPATKHQAKALNKEGFRYRVARARGKGGAVLKRVSQKFIQDHLTMGQAGLILRILRSESETGTQSWKRPLPARPILGVRPEEADKYLTAIATSVLQDTKRA
jgi:hypothetical protein